MEAASSLPFDRRVDRVREDCRSAGLDGFLVTHPPNVRYFTGLAPTAGAVVVTPARCVLIADFRYATAARELAAARRPGAIDLEVPERGYDEAIVSVLRQVDARRIGVEGASLPVSRFNRLSSSLSAAADETGAPSRAVALIATE